MFENIALIEPELSINIHNSNVPEYYFNTPDCIAHLHILDLLISMIDKAKQLGWDKQNNTMDLPLLVDLRYYLLLADYVDKLVSNIVNKSFNNRDMSRLDMSHNESIKKFNIFYSSSSKPTCDVNAIHLWDSRVIHKVFERASYLVGRMLQIKDRTNRLLDTYVQSGEIPVTIKERLSWLIYAKHTAQLYYHECVFILLDIIQVICISHGYKSTEPLDSKNTLIRWKFDEKLPKLITKVCGLSSLADNARFYAYNKLPRNFIWRPYKMTKKMSKLYEELLNV